MRLILEEMLENLQACGYIVTLQSACPINVSKLIRQLQDDNPAVTKFLRVKVALKAFLHIIIPRPILHNIKPNSILRIALNIPFNKTINRLKITIYKLNEQETKIQLKDEIINEEVVIDGFDRLLCH